MQFQVPIIIHGACPEAPVATGPSKARKHHRVNYSPVIYEITFYYD